MVVREKFCGVANIPMVYRELLKEFGGNAKARTSARGIIHVLVKTKIGIFSVYYLDKEKVYRVFFPYPSGSQGQYKVNFANTEEVVKYIRQMTGGKL